MQTYTVNISPEEPQHHCELCRRRVSLLTRHHLIPRSQHKRKPITKRFSRTEMLEHTVSLCKPCHKFIHSIITEKELALRYYSIELLLQHEEIKRFLEWIKPKPDGFHSTTRKSKK